MKTKPRARALDPAALMCRDPQRCARAAEILKGLAHPLRLQLVALLATGDEYVGAIAERLGRPQAIVSQQLRILRMHRLVSVTRSDGKALYRLAEPRIAGFLDCLHDVVTAAQGG
jgi:ArsR family transcriptional regulator, zinc-responsive transcriptional repressor